MNWYLEVLKKYAVFGDRARRKEYWMYTLFTFVIGFVLGIVDAVLHTETRSGIGLFGLLYTLATFIPGLAVSVRRLHDIGKSGWWLLLLCIPLLGWLVLLVFDVLDSQPGTNEYGPNPKEDQAQGSFA